MPRTYFHVDMDAFFVSVEELYDPSLKGKPVVVGGRPDERGVVSAASYAARKFGVHSAMPLRTAYKMCPQAIFVDGHPERYREYSRKVHDVLTAFSPLVEMASVDEAYLDITGTERLYGPPLRAAHLLHQRMKDATNLNCSIGIATSRLVAKISSDQAKPNGVLWIIPGPGSGVPGAARRAPRARRGQGDGEEPARRRHTQGRRPGAPGRKVPGAALRQVGAWRWPGNRADWMPAAGSIPKSARTPGPNRSATSTPSTRTRPTWSSIESTLARLSEMVGRRLREHKLQARTLQLKLRYSDFTTITRAHSVPRATDLDTEIFEEIRAAVPRQLEARRHRAPAGRARRGMGR